MTIDIIVPCYNAHATLDRLLASIAMQTVKDSCTVYLVDDCSDEGYEDIASRWGEVLNIETVTMPENGGPGVARQTGLDESDGDYIVFCDADDTLCTAHSLQLMAQAMESNNADIVSGRFIEECENGQFVPHGNDLVWVFAKMYRRRTIERFLVRFNSTRANEDTGFNTLLSNLTDRIVNIPQTVYTWHWSKGTITRKNNGEYTWASGHRGYIENMRWVVFELRSRNINKEIIRRLAISCLCKMYFMHEDVVASSRAQAQASMESIQAYYDEAVKPIVTEGAAHFSYIAETYKAVASETMKNEREAGIMHSMTFRDFLRKLGYYDDLKAMEAEYGRDS